MAFRGNEVELKIKKSQRRYRERKSSFSKITNSTKYTARTRSRSGAETLKYLRLYHFISENSI